MSWARETVLAPVLNRRLTLEEEVRAPDGAGGWTRAWRELGVLWAAVRARAGRELDEGGRALSRVSHRILVRAAPMGSAARPRADQRLREDGRVFRIRAVTEADARGRYLLCWADEEAEQ
ncbi:head-tail adaptor protein [Oceanicella actignis]|uniref:Head-tail adaptor n=1 Tax=Oceanicella actignis TaxID=1189325 RepID=A0A1M7TZR1_9RHOB|nr:head-tail adaptor protein [Oceanicella actignis]TYO85049.1 head-tail adaptor [Oceanicella actignis]SET83453.1 head-tail adaptor [Oceanicella actignis]SHN76204.1 head-tail adaptor [Oceanicella actignis]